MTRPKLALSLALSSTLALSLSPERALGEAASSTAAATIAVGPPAGAMPMARGDAGRTGRAPGLPSEPALAGRVQLPGGLDFPVAAGEGELVAATASGLLVSLDLDGKERWRLQLPQAPASGPVLLSGGDRVVVTVAGECLSVSPSGRPRFRVALPARARDPKALPVALVSGAVAVAAGPTLTVLSPEGRVLSRARLPEPATGSLLAEGAVIFAATDSGRVYRWAPPSEPRLVGAFGGALTSSAALSGRLVAAVVDGHRLVFFDRAAGAPSTSFSSLVTLVGPVALGPSGEAWLPTATGHLIAVAPDGRELERVALQAPLAPGADPNAQLAPPPVLVAPDGRVAFVRPTGEVGILAKGSARLSEARACAEPIGLAASEERLWVSCRDGTLAVFGAPRRDAAP